MRNRTVSSTRPDRRAQGAGARIFAATLAIASLALANAAPAQNPFGSPERRAERAEKREKWQAARAARQGEAGVSAAGDSSAIAAPSFPAEAAKYMDAGPYAVAVWTEDWTDAKRDGRVVPVKLYMPDCCEGTRHPVILVSHGLGGSRDGLAYLGNHFASHGFVAVVMQHAGSDTPVLREAMAAGDLKAGLAKAMTAKAFLDRNGDPPFVLDELARLNAATEGKLAGRLDLERVGIAGHSYGAGTSLAMAGQGFGPRAMSLGDARFKAAAPLSAPPPNDKADLAKTYAGIAIPILHMTGTLDDSPVNDTTASERRVPFDNIAGVDQYLVTFDGGDHMVFSGERRPGASWSKGDPAKDAAFHPLILSATLAFFEAYLNGDADAKAWLADGGYEAALGSWGVYEKKGPDDPPTVAASKTAQSAASDAAPAEAAPQRRGLFRRK